MAIIGPTDLPAVIKVNDREMKRYVLSKLGHPVVEAELTEDQFEIIWRIVGDWIAGYFPKEQRLAVFYTTPLKSTYPLPADAYWIQEVRWDPVTTRLDDVFGAEAFLFCVAPELKVLAADGSLQMIGDWKKDWRAKTPYGNKRLKVIKHQNQRDLPKTRIEYAGGIVEATENHVLALANGKWREFSEVQVGDVLCAVGNKVDVHNIARFADKSAIGVRALAAGCYYGCIEGEPILLH